MTPKSKSSFVCQNCGYVASKWIGKCPDCGEWNSLVEERMPIPSASALASRGLASSTPVSFDAVASQEQSRFSSGIAELDRVLGGGVVTGSLVLIGGDPGIGKSTLLLQVSRLIAQRAGPVLYVSGEESAGQVKLRADRLGPAPGGLYFVAETDLEAVEAHVAEVRPRVLVVDSIQTVYLPGLESAPGSVSQVRECGARLMALAKGRGIATFLVGHVTKEGAIAGPRVLEHLVDTVLYFESEASSRFRIVRATKNRFGAVNELGFFAMTEGGLREIRNPSAIFLARAPEPAAGSVVTVTREGGRPLLIELQALVDRMRFGAPRRIAQGLDSNRVAMLLAVLNRHAGVSLQEHDVFVNVVGGMQISETAWDLPVVVALASSLKDRALERSLVVFGEIGLTGEVRPV